MTYIPRKYRREMQERGTRARAIYDRLQRLGIGSAAVGGIMLHTSEAEDLADLLESLSDAPERLSKIRVSREQRAAGWSQDA
jgi:coenzyme F420-reducing hydrogenase delta subunit